MAITACTPCPQTCSAATARPAADITTIGLSRPQGRTRPRAMNVKPSITGINKSSTIASRQKRVPISSASLPFRSPGADVALEHQRLGNATLISPSSSNTSARLHVCSVADAALCQSNSDQGTRQAFTPRQFLKSVESSCLTSVRWAQPRLGVSNVRLTAQVGTVREHFWIGVDKRVHGQKWFAFRTDLSLDDGVSRAHRLKFVRRVLVFVAVLITVVSAAAWLSIATH